MMNLLYREGDHLMQMFWTKINKIVDESPEVKTYYFDLPEGFTWEEGAHTHIGLKGFNEGEKPNRALVRHMSFCTLPSENIIGITTRIKEQCSEFKAFLRTHKVGDEVALFKIHSNVPLRRENKNIYLLSSGVGLATFRPLVMTYLANQEAIPNIHSLNIDSSKDLLYPDIFTSVPEKNFTAEVVHNRIDYYEAVKNLSADVDGLYYIVGSDEFIMQTLEVLQVAGIKPEQISLDKRQMQLEKFFPTEATV